MPMSSDFDTTQWSLVLAAQGDDTALARRALEDLCKAYWQPLYAFVRRQGHSIDEARDLTQAYFTHLLEKDSLRGLTPDAGRFRSFLLTSIKNLLADERRRELALKRGSRSPAISLDFALVENTLPIEPSDERTPETLFEKRWALTVLERTLERVREDSTRRGASRTFEHLKRYLTGEQPTPSYREVAAELDMTEEAVAMAVHRLRKRYGQSLRDEIGGTIAVAEDVDDEIRYLLAVLSS